MKCELYELTANGLQKPKKYEIPRGQILTLESPFPGRQKVAVISHESGNYRDCYKCVDLVEFELLTVEHPRPYSDKFGIGYYYNAGNVISESELIAAISKVPEYDQKRREKKAVEIEAKNKKDAELVKKWEHLPARGSDYATAKKNIAFELKTAFPGIKFSIKKRGYDTMNIHYNDGAPSEKIKKIVNKYRGKDFDGMQDLEIRTGTAFTANYGECGYIFVNREYSDHVYNDISNQLYNIDYDNLEKCQRWEDQRFIWRCLSNVDFTEKDYETIVLNILDYQ